MVHCIKFTEFAIGPFHIPQVCPVTFFTVTVYLLDRCLLRYDVAVGDSPNGPFKVVNKENLLFTLYVVSSMSESACVRY